MNKKIVVLDDDPYGTQIVHGIYVYTSWTTEVLTEAFQNANKLFYILTNSRSLTEKQTEALHREIVKNLISVSEKTNCDFDIISRSDSSLRGHYPLEINVIREELEKSGKKIQCEFIIPFFKEGGRITEGDIHYIEQKGAKIPIGESEFAKDPLFGFKSSNLKEWIEEKTKGNYAAKDVKSITLDMLRTWKVDVIKNVILETGNAQKVIVNAVNYSDLKAFIDVLNSPELQDKRFLFRTGASFVKVFGNISDKSLLMASEFKKILSSNGGIIFIGSYLDKSTLQLENLLNNKGARPYELNVHITNEMQMKKIINYIIKNINLDIEKGITSVVYTSRKSLIDPSKDSEANLNILAKISNYLVSIVKGLMIAPGFILVKGGNTSTDIATKGLGMKKVLVLGQISPGIPVWLSDEESKFPKIPYIVFPGTAGEETSLTKIYDKLVEMRD